MKNAINWFEIPAMDFERAKKFYETVLGEPLKLPFPGMKYAMLPHEGGGVGGGLMEEDGFVPLGGGPMIYLNGGEDLSVPLSRVEAAGGKILLPKTAIGGNGFMARFLDTEGNLLALHSMK